MEQKMELILSTPIEKLSAQMIKWNNKELMNQVKGALEKYKDKTYDDKSIVEAKADRAGLNAFTRSLNDERIRIGRVYNAPYEKFKAEVDEVLKLVKQTSSEISNQIKLYENAKAEDKTNTIKKYFNDNVGDLAECIKFEQIEQPRWKNVTVSLKNIYAEIDNQLSRIQTELNTIEALESPDEETLKVIYFRTLNLSTAITENQRLAQERQRIAELKAKKKEQQLAKQSMKQPIGQTNKPKEQMTQYQEKQKNQVYTLGFEVTCTIEQLRALKHCLIENKISYKQI